MPKSRQYGLLALLGRTVRSSAGVVLLGVMLAPQALAEGPVFTDNDGSAEYWKPGRLMRATPLEAPLAAMMSEEAVEALGAKLPSPAEEEVSGYGAYVAEGDEVAPDLKARIHPALPDTTPELEEVADWDVQAAAAGGAQPLDVGTSGGYFSSSRLVPANARLSYPYSTVGKLFFVVPGQGAFVCSAVALRPRLVLTAGHCVHRGSGGVQGFFTNFVFVPAFHRGQAPFKAWSWSFVVTTGSWASNGHVPNRADYAILGVRDRRVDGQLKRIGDVTGFLGYRTGLSALFPNHTKNIGYPVNFDNGQIAHQVDSQSFRRFAEGTVLYASDMTGGSSGGPWVENFGASAEGQTAGVPLFSNRVVGLTSFGFLAPNPKLEGSSILNQEFLQILDFACNQARGNCTPL